MAVAKRIVVWSGGSDSTLALCNEAWSGIEVTALTITNHSLCNKEHFKCQEKAQNEFKKFAKEKEWTINFESVSITGTAILGDPNIKQAYLWVTQLMPYFGHGDSVMWGYIEPDSGFWHWKEEFNNILKALEKYSGIKTYHDFPLEYYSKADVVRGLRGHCVPLSCIWTCETPNKGKHCGICRKCQALHEACAEINLTKKKKPKKINPINNFEKLISW